MKLSQQVFQSLTKAVKQSYQRFPIVTNFTFALTAYLLLLVWNKDAVSLEGHRALSYYLCAGSLLSLSLAFFGEEIKRRELKQIVSFAAHALLLADAVYLYFLPSEAINTALVLSRLSIWFAVDCTVPLLPFFREKDDTASWNFTLRLLSDFATCMLIGLAMWGGTALLLLSIGVLFTLTIENNIYDSLPVAFLQLLPTLLFLGRVPGGEKKHDRSVHPMPFLSKVVRYLFLPLLGAYLAVLYIYALRILVLWQLPDGTVSFLVTALMAGMIGFVLFYYPALRRGLAPRFETQTARFLPLLILPLLLLMSVGISRRICDYGITLNRLYLLTLNGWFYFVCLGLLFTRTRRVNWIAYSFAGLFVLSSVVPSLSYASLTQRYLFKKVEETIQRTYSGKLPMDKKTYTDWLDSRPLQEAQLVNSRLRALDELDDRSARRLIASQNYPHVVHSTAFEAKDSTFYIYSNNGSYEYLPENALINRIQYLHHTSINQGKGSTRGDTLLLALPLSASAPRDSVKVSIENLRKWDHLNRPEAPVRLDCCRSGARFIMKECSISLLPDSVTATLTGVYYSTQ